MTNRPALSESSSSRVRVAAALAHWCSPFSSDAAPPSLDDAGWAALAELADSHKVTALVATRIAGAGRADDLPRVIADRLDDARQSAGCLYRARSLVIAELFERLERAGVRPMLLKGQALAERLYDPPVVRLGRDVDILVRATEMPAATASLASLGYAPANPERYASGHFHQPWYSPRRAASGPVELHWDVVEPGDPVRFDIDAWWSGAVPHRFPFGEALLPPRAAEFAYVTFHALQHGTATLRDLSDVALLAATSGDGDRDEIAEVARRAGCSGFLDVAAWLIAVAWGNAALRGPLTGRPGPSRLARVLFDPQRLVANGPEKRWSRLELARWCCLPRERAGLAEPFRRAIARHRKLATDGEGSPGVLREAKVAVVLAASLARALARA